MSDTFDDLKKTFSASQLDVVRGLDAAAGLKRRGGWRIGGMPRKETTVKPVILAGIAAETFRFGKHRLELTHTGRAFADRLAGRVKGPDVEHPIKRRADIFG